MLRLERLEDMVDIDDTLESRQVVLDFIADNKDSIARIYDGYWNLSFPIDSLLCMLGFDTRERFGTPAQGMGRRHAKLFPGCTVRALHCYDEDRDKLLALLRELEQRFPASDDMGETSEWRPYDALFFDGEYAMAYTCVTGKEMEPTDEYIARISSDDSCEKMLREYLSGTGFFDSVDKQVAKRLERPYDECSTSERWHACADIISESIAREGEKCWTIAAVKRRSRAKEQADAASTRNRRKSVHDFLRRRRSAVPVIGMLVAYYALATRCHVVTALKKVIESPSVILGAMCFSDQELPENMGDVIDEDAALPSHMNAYAESMLSTMMRSGADYVQFLSDMRECLAWERCCGWGRQKTRGGGGARDHLIYEGMRELGYATSGPDAAVVVADIKNQIYRERGRR